MLAPELDEAARGWIADDPDPATRGELEQALRAAQAGSEDATADLADRFSGLLQFGTAGLRGRLGAGPNRMNRVVVRRAAAGLTAYLQQSLGHADVTVIIGYDARHNSDVFARDTAAVVTAAGGRALLLPRPLPTPVLAFAIRWAGADAGVMVTASHNPPQDNGYKVYLGDGSQIVPPADAQIAAAIDTFPTAASVPVADDGWEVLGDEVEQDYIAAAVGVVPDGTPRDVSVVHTSLHGVGHEVVQAAFCAAGFPAPRVVAAQSEPDPDFPTVAFPNPEEPGAIDAALALAGEVGPDLVIANDPDADRCAVAVADPNAPGGWRMLHGDEVGALLGAQVLDELANGTITAAEPVLARSIVSSRLLGAMASAAGVEAAETLTGFKWISRVPNLVYGYEEALGYCVAPTVARDKDGVTAALLITAMAARLRAQGRTLTDVLDDLAVQHGVYATDAYSVRVQDLTLIPRLMERLRTAMPDTIAGQAVVRTDDLAAGDGGLPPTEGLRWYLADQTRVIARPSGTEPKLKVYLEVIVPVDGGAAGLTAARTEAAARLGSVRVDLERLTSL